MGIFSTGGYTINNEPLDIENMTYEESAYENPFEAGMNLVAESENNYNNIMKAIAMDELYALESTGAEIVYESGRLKSFFTKVKDFFKKLWEKIKGIFVKFFASINSMVLKDKEFVKKYKKALSSVDTKNFTYKGFEFTNLNAPVKDPQSIREIKTLAQIDADKDINSIKNYTESISDDNYTDIVDKFRGDLLKDSKIESDYFADDLFKYFRNGEDSKVEIDKVDTNEQMKLIENTSDMKKQGEKALKDIKDPFDKVIKALEEAERKAIKDIPTSDEASAKATAYSATVKILKEAFGAAQLFTTAKLKAIKDQNAQAKSICVKLLTYKPKNESASFVHTEGGSFLDMVEFR